MFSKTLHKAITAPIAFATAGAKLRRIKSEYEIQNSEVMTLDLNFQFPRPREQISQNFLDNSHYMSAAKDSKRKQNAIKKRNDDSKTYVHLVHSILRGESGHTLTEKIEEAKGIQTLLHLKLRTKDTASRQSLVCQSKYFLNKSYSYLFQADPDSEVSIKICFSLFQLAVMENKPQTFLTMLKYFK